MLQATQDPKYLDAGAAMITSLNKLNQVEGGWASMQSVHTGQLEDHMPSYFLAEACKYLYLLFDDSFLQVPRPACVRCSEFVACMTMWSHRCVILVQEVCSVHLFWHTNLHQPQPTFGSHWPICFVIGCLLRSSTLCHSIWATAHTLTLFQCTLQGQHYTCDQ